MSASAEVRIRGEMPADRAMVRAVNEAAFGGAEEADLVEALWLQGSVLLSLVADLDRRIVGHVLFSRMSIETPAARVDAVALAPMAVLPGNQRRGIGGMLIRAGLESLRTMGERIVIVVGHAEYYPRFGFSSALTRSLEGPFPPDVFMALELEPGALEGIRGRVRYPDAFGL